MRMLFARAFAARHVRHLRIKAAACYNNRISTSRWLTSSNPTITMLEFNNVRKSLDQGIGRDVEGPDDPLPFRLRSYQTEMVEESLKQNIIVTMDTGSGKTHIAIARTEAELQNCDPDKIVWFLAPTVPLCDQQAQMFEKYLPAYQLRFLSGKDNVDAWSNQRIWDAILKDTRIVVSTPQVLLDALSHGFVKMNKIALLIFDEAHMCRGKHPASQIMQDFYHVDSLHEERTSLPHILGLTATPVVNASGNDLGVIEKSLNALAMAPKMHRTELIQYTHKPELVKLMYETSSSGASEEPPILVALRKAYQEYDIEKDPYILSLRQRSLEETSAQERIFHELNELLQNRKTYVHEQLRKLYVHALMIFNELGETATDFYLRSVIKKFGDYASTMRMMFADWLDEEGEVLKSILSQLNDCPRSETEKISPKMETLINFVVSEALARSDITCIIFAGQRATVASMQFLLATHTQTKELFSIGTFVGMSSLRGKRKSNIALCDLASIKEQGETLEDFKTGKKNLIIATSVLEEGIDVSTCNTVICYDPPRNMKSFIQRRGRARKQDSKYVLMLPPDSSLVERPEKWTQLEQSMQVVYQNHCREIQQAEAQEEQHEEGHLLYRVRSTGARLTLDNCIPRLYNFCGLLGLNTKYDFRPEFSFKQDDSGLVVASVDLPAAVEAKLRHHTSERAWKTERFARKDAAFQAYKALHQSGLLNDNLRPLNKYSDHDPFKDADESQFSRTPSLLQVPERVRPWVQVAADYIQNPGTRKWSRIKISLALGEETFQIVFSFPAPAIAPPELKIYWSTGELHALRFEVLEPRTYAVDEVEALQASTHAFFSSAGIFVENADESVILCERWEDGKGQSFTSAVLPAQDVYQALRNKENPPKIGLVTNRCENNAQRYLFKGFSHEKPESNGQSEVLNIKLTSYPMPKGHVLRKSNHEAKAAKRKVLSLAASNFLISSIPLGYSILARCLPPVVHQLELLMVSDQLCKTTLAEVGYKDSNLVLRAISAGSSTDTDYERLENLGDAVLKFITCLNIVAEHPNWPEYFLTRRKDLIVSNAVLTKASLNVGLDKFLVKDAYNELKSWRVQSATTLVNSPSGSTRGTSSKILADLIESLIAAAYVEGGIPKALRGVKTLLPFYPWKSVDQCRSVLVSHAESNAESNSKPIHLEQLEELLGYKFSNPLLLLEAMTHGSRNSFYGVPTSTYQQLEFLGDSILDMIITRRIYAFGNDLSPRAMHEVKTTVVSEGMLNFLAFELVQYRTLPRVRVDEQSGKATVEEQGEYKRTALWQWIRHSSPTLLEAFRETEANHEKIRNTVLEALEHDTRFPWKYFEPSAEKTKVPSDVMEAIIGAIFIDSTRKSASSLTGVEDANADANADVDDPSPLDGQAAGLSACEDFIERTGLFRILDRLLRDGVNCLNRYASLLESVPSQNRSMFKRHPFYNKETGDWTCRILFGDRVLVEKDAVKARAKDIAIREAAGVGQEIVERETAKGVKIQQLGRKATSQDLTAPTIDFQERLPSPPPSSSYATPLSSPTLHGAPTPTARRTQRTLERKREREAQEKLKRQSQESGSSAYTSAHEEMDEPVSSSDGISDEIEGEPAELADSDDDQVFYPADEGADDLDRVELAEEDDVNDMDLDVRAQETLEEDRAYERGEKLGDEKMGGKEMEGEEMEGDEMEGVEMEGVEMEGVEVVGEEKEGEEMEGEEARSDVMENEAMDVEELENEATESEENQSEAMDSEAMESEEVESEGGESEGSSDFDDILGAFEEFTDEENFESSASEKVSIADQEAGKQPPALLKILEGAETEARRAGELFALYMKEREKRGRSRSRRLSNARKHAAKLSAKKVHATKAETKPVKPIKLKRTAAELEMLRKAALERRRMAKLKTLLKKKTPTEAELTELLAYRVSMRQGNGITAAPTTPTMMVEEERNLWNLEQGTIFRVRGVKGHFTKLTDDIDSCLYVPPSPSPSQPPSSPSQKPSARKDKRSKGQKHSTTHAVRGRSQPPPNKDESSKGQKHSIVGAARGRSQPSPGKDDRSGKGQKHSIVGAAREKSRQLSPGKDESSSKGQMRWTTGGKRR
ncbi:hypothetical protein BKA81DRAFT_366321 [Phyllosticta paracitricarpa]|uniref:Dicer-like protein 2 n=1 Tax=Phyllosticta paracitricarpa TaxID=2016321 RepID=A0ABR1N1B6_9PEZI